MRIADSSHMAEMSRRIAIKRNLRMNDYHLIALACLDLSRLARWTYARPEIFGKKKFKKQASAYICCARYNRLLSEMAKFHDLVSRAAPSETDPIWRDYGETMTQWYDEFCKSDKRIPVALPGLIKN
jgi:hypothetical protein